MIPGGVTLRAGHQQADGLDVGLIDGEIADDAAGRHDQDSIGELIDLLQILADDDQAAAGGGAGEAA